MVMLCLPVISADVSNAPAVTAAVVPGANPVTATTRLASSNEVAAAELPGAVSAGEPSGAQAMNRATPVCWEAAFTALYGAVWTTTHFLYQWW